MCGKKSERVIIYIANVSFPQSTANVCVETSREAQRLRDNTPSSLVCFDGAPFAWIGGLWLTCSCQQTEHLTLLPHLSRLSERQGPLQSGPVIGPWLPRPLNWFHLLNGTKLYGNQPRRVVFRREMGPVCRCLEGSIGIFSLIVFILFPNDTNKRTDHCSGSMQNMPPDMINRAVLNLRFYMSATHRCNQGWINGTAVWKKCHVPSARHQSATTARRNWHKSPFRLNSYTNLWSAFSKMSVTATEFSVTSDQVPSGF